MAKITVFCAHCGNPKEIQPSAVRKNNFCNLDCFGMFIRNRTTHTCQNCGSEFEYRGKVERIYCSAVCKYAAIAKRYLGAGNPVAKEKIKKVCQRCAKPFAVHECDSETKYCSRKCRTEDRQSAWKEKPCPVCGKMFIYNRNGRDKKTCSKQCAHSYSSIAQKGEKSWRWAGGAFPDYGPRWEVIAEDIRSRDRHICRHCGKSGSTSRKRLEVHHIIPIRSFSGDHASANVQTNLITLCTSCHMKAEHGTITATKLRSLIR